MCFFFSALNWACCGCFQLLLPPALAVLVADVHVLGADGAAVGFAQRVEQVAQGHGVLAEEGVAGVEHRFLVGVGEAVERGSSSGIFSRSVRLSGSRSAQRAPTLR
jgi:hypothetical protein